VSTKPLKGALIGAGNVKPFHLQAWERIPQASIVAIADPDLDKARTRAREFGIDPGRVFTSLSDLLQAKEGLDFLDIATPPHVLCQKPFALRLAEARAMIKACQRAGVVLGINENWRWRPWYRAIRSMISQGKIGRPIYARFFAHSSAWLPTRVRPPNHRLHGMKQVIFLEWGIHLVDVLRFLFGEPDSVYARMAGLSPELIGEDRAVVMLAFGELTALIDISWSSCAPWGAANRIRHNVEHVRIEGDAGTIVLFPDPSKGDLIRLITAQEEWERPAYERLRTHRGLLAYLRRRPESFRRMLAEW
jgi:predicted dehydrogenase